MAGYSGRSLVEKLGIKPSTRIAILDAPRGYRATLGKLPPGVRVVTSARATLSFIHLFVVSRASLEKQITKATDLDKVAKAQGLTVQESGFFAHDEPILGLGPSPEAASRAFEMKVGDVSPGLRASSTGTRIGSRTA